MTVYEAFTQAYAAKVGAPARTRQRSAVLTVLAVILGRFIGTLSVALTGLRRVAYVLAASGLGVFAAWHTFGVGAAAVAGMAALLILEWRVRG